MKTTHIILLTAFAAGLAAVVPAVGQEDTQQSASPAQPTYGGALRTMPHGTYQCALPGDAGGAAYIELAEESFRIFTASRYESMNGAGTYILRGNELTFTRGPKNGEKFQRISDNQLRKIGVDGSQTEVLCTRRGSR